MRTGGNCRTVDREISGSQRKERLHMPGSSTTPDRPGARDIASVRVAFRARNSVGTRGLAFAAQWLAYALPYRRFVAVLADANARLGADVDRYSFIVVDLHHLLLAGLPAHFESYHPSQAVRSPPANTREGSTSLTIAAFVHGRVRYRGRNRGRKLARLGGVRFKPKLSHPSSKYP